MHTTLYRSLQKATEMAKDMNFPLPAGVSSEQFHIHVPETGVILSPDVEVFRAGSNDGYRFKQAATNFTSVISMAMPNKNYSVKDSPVDAPRDPRAYEDLVLRKMTVALHTAAHSGADTFVIP